jgi:hypothetical protein
MIIRTIFRGGKYPPVKRGVLYLTLIGVDLIVFLPIAWMYQKLKLGMGVEVAQISLTIAMLRSLELVLVGIGMAYFIDSAILRRKFIFHAPQPGSWVDALIRAWGFDLRDEQPENPAIAATAQALEVVNALAILNKPRRRGRKPSYSIDRWRRVVLNWESRDTLRNTMTLADMLAEEFGTHADGSPRMSEQSYYDWRDKVLSEIKNEAEALNSSCKATRD